MKRVAVTAALVLSALGVMWSHGELGAACEVVATSTAGSNSSHDGYETEIAAEITVQTICGDPGAPAAASGGGEGGASPCETTPLGPLAEVQAVWAAVNAEQAPNPSDPNYVEDVYNPAGDPSDDVVIEQSWFRIHGTDIQVKYTVTCPGALSVAQWVTVIPDSSGNLVPQVRAVDLVSALHAQVVRSLPTPLPRVGPADENPDGWTYVQHRTFFWVDEGAGQWETVSGSTSSGGISVTVQAVPERLVVNPGDGSEAVVCVGAPVPVTRSNYHQNHDRGCAHRYRNSSAMAENGETFPVVASIVWHASWSASTGEGGDLGYLSTTSEVRDLAVAEIQAVIVNADP